MLEISLATLLEDRWQVIEFIVSCMGVEGLLRLLFCMAAKGTFHPTESAAESGPIWVVRRGLLTGAAVRVIRRVTCLGSES
jgi:hypothetical protein